MIREFINKTMSKASYEILEDNTFAGKTKQWLGVIFFFKNAVYVTERIERCFGRLVNCKNKVWG